MIDFVEWIEAYSAGWLARDNYPDDDGKALFIRMHEAHQNSGGQRALKVIEKIEDESKTT